MANGIDSMEITRVDKDKYRIVLTGQGLTLDALLIGAGSEPIINALEAAGDPRPLLNAYRAKRGGKRP